MQTIFIDTYPLIKYNNFLKITSEMIEIDVKTEIFGALYNITGNLWR